MKLISLKISTLILLNLLFSPFCHSQDNKKEALHKSKKAKACHEVVEKRIKQIFSKEDADKIFSAHETYEVNLNLIKLILGMAEENKSMKDTLERYNFSPTDQNLLHFFKEAEKVINEEVKRNPSIGDWKFIGQRYGGLSSIVYIHVYNFPDGVPVSRNRDHLLTSKN